MKVSMLMNLLAHMPNDADVMYIWDGEARSSVEHVWLSKGDCVMLCDADAVVYSDEIRPKDAPSEADSPYWQTPELL